MPYHVFQINAFKQYEHLDSFEAYRDAKDALKKLRIEQGSSSANTYRMMHASSPEHACQLLQEKREPRPMGEHD